MKARSRWWGLPIFLYVLCSLPLHPQAITVSENAINRAENPLFTAEPEAIAPPELMTGGQETPAPPHTAAEPAKEPYGWHYAIYPALAWAPIFGASVTLPPSPSHPIEPASGTTDTSFNGAYFGGARIEKGKWSADALFMWAALGAERKTPTTSVDIDFVFGDALVGREILPGLYVEGGARRLALDVSATVDSDSVSRSPGFWDPLVGLTYRRELGKKWRVLVHGDGGGFGVGSDVDVTATGRAEWQFARHFGLAMGYGGMHLSESNTVDGKTLTISPTMHGPIFGLGIFF
jgi:hypothetical protein